MRRLMSWGLNDEGSKDVNQVYPNIREGGKSIAKDHTPDAELIGSTQATPSSIEISAPD